MRQQTRLLGHSTSARHAVTGQHLLPLFIAVSKSSWVEHTIHSTPRGAGCGDAWDASVATVGESSSNTGGGDAIDGASTHAPFSQTRAPLQSLSFLQPPSLHPATRSNRNDTKANFKTILDISKPLLTPRLGARLACHVERFEEGLASELGGERGSRGVKRESSS